MVPEAGLEPAQPEDRGILSPLCLPIPPLRQEIESLRTHNMEATPRFELGIMILQTIALPLGDVATIKWSGRRDSNSRQPRWQRGALPLSYSRSLRKAKSEFMV